MSWKRWSEYVAVLCGVHRLDQATLFVMDGLTRCAKP